MSLTPAQIQAWAAIAQIVVTTIGGTIDMVKAIFRAGGLTDEQMNEILQTIAVDALAKQAISQAEIDKLTGGGV